MTSIISIRQEDRIVIASDGAVYDDDGRLRGEQCKVMALPHLSAAYGYSGEGDVGTAFLFALGQNILSFDALVDSFARTVRRASSFFLGDGQPPVKGTVLIAGWSDSRHRFEHYGISTFSREFRDAETEAMVETEPFEVRSLPAVWGSSGMSQASLNRVGVTSVDKKFEATDLASRLVAAARLESHPGTNEKCVYAVGCFLQLTIVQRDAVEQRIIHRWPDPIGEVIDPARGSLLPPSLHSDAA